ncbi:phage tail tube protein [Synergistes jonesii]|uniref:phage tail tube protein n=1 Tax=Synergistes jonesii TaxID=2754 RepID=UPI00243000DE|nr:phage major tail protein, TP901-1 family [Synergistes jonesii]
MPVTLPDNPNTSNSQVGKDFLLKINLGDASYPTWTIIGAQRSTDLNRTADSIDVSHKTSGNWKGFKAGLRGWSIDLGGLVLLGDTGLEALEAAYEQGIEINVCFMYPDGSIQEGWGSITELSISTPHDGAAEISGTVEGNGQLTPRRVIADGGGARVYAGAQDETIDGGVADTTDYDAVVDGGTAAD